MKLAFISDVHGNLQALTAVLDDISRFYVDKLVSLGDVVNYGADSKKCLELVLKEADILVLGNHEEAILNDDFSRFSSGRGARAAEETSRSISTEMKSKIAMYFLPTRILELGDVKILMNHAGINDRWKLACNDHGNDHVYSMYDYVIFGHSHLPYYESRKMSDGEVARRVRFLNPGSVGQPRDGFVSASWMYLDTETGAVEFKRVPYDNEGAFSDIIERTNFDDYYATRLLRGC